MDDVLFCPRCTDPMEQVGVALSGRTAWYCHHCDSEWDCIESKWVPEDDEDDNSGE
jgi:hypothetical protein